MISFSIDSVHRTRIATFTGVVDDAQLAEAYGGLLSQPDYDASLDDLADMRSVERLEVSTHMVRQLVDMFTPIDTLGLTTRLAIVASRDHVFGMARMYEILRSDAPEQIRVFRDYDEAIGWLGLRD